MSSIFNIIGALYRVLQSWCKISIFCVTGKVLISSLGITDKVLISFADHLDSGPIDLKRVDSADRLLIVRYSNSFIVHVVKSSLSIG